MNDLRECLSTLRAAAEAVLLDAIERRDDGRVLWHDLRDALCIARQESGSSDLFESGWADAHTGHRDPNLWLRHSYRGGWLAASTREFPSTDAVTEATRQALSLDGIKSATFRTGQNGFIVGTVWDGFTGMEYDVRQLQDGGWNVNDDNGIDYRYPTLVEALMATPRDRER